MRGRTLLRSLWLPLTPTLSPSKMMGRGRRRHAVLESQAMTSPLLPRRASIPVDVGGVTIGGDAPIVVQSMTNTDTADVEATARQSAELAAAGSEIVRITVDRDEAAKAVPHIRDRLAQMGAAVPLVGDFHYNGHTLLSREPRLRRGARQVSHQPRQRRLQGQARPAVLGHRRAGPEARQARAHRRQLGQPRPGAAHAPDGRERGVAGAEGRPRRHARGHRAVGPALGRARGGAGA